MVRYYRPKVNKYITFAASIPIALSGGLAYLFSVWQPALQKSFDLTPKQIEIIAATANLGGYSSFISGLVYDALEHRHHVGPRISILFGSIASFLGFFGLWAAVTKRFIAETWQLAALAALAGNGGTWFDTCSLATNLRNFPAQRGPVVGIIKAAVGLSASLYTAAYVGVFQPNVEHFLLFLAITPASVGLIMLSLINFVPYVQRSELEHGYTVFSPDGRFLFALQTLGTLALYLMATALATAFGVDSASARGLFALGALVLLCPLLFIPIGSGGIFANKASIMVRAPTDIRLDESENGDGTSAANETEPLREALLEAPAAPVIVLESQVAPMPSYFVGQCFKLLDFWLVAFIVGTGIGCGLAFLNNVAPLVTAISGPPEARSVVVSLFGVASCIGRLFFGAVPEKALHLYGVPRPAFLSAAGFVMSATCAGLAFSGVPALYALSFAAGFAFGAHWSLLPALTSELFGLDSFASIYTLLQLAPATAGYGLGAGLVGTLYTKAIQRHGDPEGPCIGNDCFKAAFLVLAGLAGAAGFLSLVLMYRTWRLYKTEAQQLRSFDAEPAVEEEEERRVAVGRQ